MKLQLLSLFILLASLLAMPGAQAVPGPATEACEFYRHQAVASVVNVVTAGDNELWATGGGYCSIMARSATDVIRLTGNYNGPVFLGLGVATYAWSFAAGGGPTGCTIAAPTANIGTLVGSAEADMYTLLTMTSNHCQAVGTFSVNLIVAAVSVYQWRAVWPIDIRVEQTTFSNNNANFDFLCGAPEIVANNYNPATVVCQEPQFNNLNYFCAATGAVPDVFSETTTTCNTPTINAALSGTVNAILSGTLALSGTLTVSDDAGGWVIHQDPLSGTLTINPLTGTFTVHQDPICTAAAHCHIDQNGNTTLIGNSTSTTTLNVPPGFWELFGPILLAVMFAGLISWLGIWVIPGGAAIGFAIFLHAFKQPYPFLVLLQACAGIILAIFCLIVLALKIKDLARGKKREPRRFFD